MAGAPCSLIGWSSKKRTLCSASPCLARRFCSQKRMMLCRSCGETGVSLARGAPGTETWAQGGHLRGKEAQLALHVLVDEVLFAGEAAGAPAKLGLHCLPQTQLVGPSEQAVGRAGHRGFTVGPRLTIPKLRTTPEPHLGTNEWLAQLALRGAGSRVTKPGGGGGR